MKSTQTICGITVQVDICEDYACPSHIKQQFSSLEKAVEYMKNNDVIYKPIRQGDKMVTLEITKTAQANENWYENEMRLTSRHMNPAPDLPTDMWE
jgi:hypothetical protein